MKTKTMDLIEETLGRCPKLVPLRKSIMQAISLVAVKGRKVLVCGNGGSCADSGHIVGELMKEFRIKRPRAEGVLGGVLAEAIPAIDLTAQTALITAIANDVGADFVFAQQVMVYCEKGDNLIAISTSGNANNVVNAVVTAKKKGGTVIALTGADGGKLRGLADILLNVPETETYKVQELHLPLYHLICACAEIELWG